MTGDAARQASSIENVLLITVDSLRCDWTLTEEVQLPAVETLKRDGVEFSQAFATGPGTTPSFPAMLTGTLPLSYGGLGPLTDERPRVAGTLHNSGVTTGGFNSNPFLSRHFNYDVGFDTFTDYQNPLMGVATRLFPRGIELTTPGMQRLDELLHLTDAIKKGYELLKGKPRPYVSAETVTTDAISWLGETAPPFFGWVHYMDVHHPCFPPEQYRTQFGVGDISQSTVSEWYSRLLTEPATLSRTDIETLRRLYDAAVAYTDSQVGRLIETLRDRGLYETTAIIFTSDHGELFGEHGEYGKPERLYDELLRVPLVITNGPASLADHTTELVSLLDLPPLIHDLLDVPVPAAYTGQSLDTDRDWVIAEHEVEGDVIVGARSEEWLFVADERRGEHRLFDLRDGSFQQVAPNEQPAARDLRDAVFSRLDTLDVSTPQLERELQGGVQDRLKELGYL